MDDLKINSLSVEGFRSFKHLQVDGIGRVNLVVGKNNSGKSSLLEAVRIISTEGAPSTLASIIDYREESPKLSNEDSPNADNILAFSGLFNGFPLFSEKSGTIKLVSVGSQSHTLLARIASYVEKNSEEGRVIVPAENDLFGQASGFSVIEIDYDGRKKILPMEKRTIERYSYRSRYSYDISAQGWSLPVQYIDPYSSKSTAQLSDLYDAAIMGNMEDEMNHLIRFISPDIDSVRMIGSNPRGRMAVARNKFCKHPIPLRSYGDGTNRLLGVILALVNAKGGFLLIDEIENGFHHTVLDNIWECIFDLAQKLSVQVFATSHSWDCIESFQNASAKLDNSGVLIRLTRKDEATYSTIFTGDELAIATRERIEIR